MTARRWHWSEVWPAVALCAAGACAASPARPDANREAAGAVGLDGTRITPTTIDATVIRVMAAARVPGVALAILNDGRVAYLKAYGWRASSASCR